MINNTPNTTPRGQFRTSSQDKLRSNLPNFLQWNGKAVSSVKQLAEVTGLSCTAIYQALHRGHLQELDIPHLGKLILVDDFIAYLDRPLGRPRKEIKD